MLKISEQNQGVAPAGGKKTWVNVFFEHLFLHGPVDVDLVMRWRMVSREWMDALNHALPLLRKVSFPVGITGDSKLEPGQAPAALGPPPGAPPPDDEGERPSGDDRKKSSRRERSRSRSRERRRSRSLPAPDIPARSCPGVCCVCRMRAPVHTAATPHARTLSCGARAGCPAARGSFG